MDVEKTTHELIALTYDAALAPEKWHALMAKMVSSIGSNTALLREVNYTTGEVGLYKTLGFDPTYTKAYCDHFVHLDFFAPAIIRAPIGAVTHGDQVVPWQQQRKSEFCNDYLLAQNNRYCLGITLARQSDHHLLFALQRTKRQGDFSDQHLQLVRTLAPHMTRAIDIHRQLLAITAQQQWALSALNSLKLGIILLDEQGKPGFINQHAETLIAASYGLSIQRNKLHLCDNLAAARLEHLIASAAMAANGRRYSAGGSVRCTNNLGKHLHLQVIPLRRNRSKQPWNFALAGGGVAVFISTTGGAQLRAEALAELYGLTAAEAKLAARLAEGLSLEDAANRLGVSIQTLRSQLKAVFAKTQVSRQAELVALLLSDMLSHQLTG